ncbi:MAG TPA: UbiA family prenyltransferase [Nitrococcus sp.]|nr:UbiA family prenyltransferase [Nitrococcus sp.]
MPYAPQIPSASSISAAASISLLPQPQAQPSPPLIVDLDGTLLSTDLLHESVFALIRRSPGYLFCLPVWLLRGKARLKDEIARRIDLDIPGLPFNESFLAHLKAEKASGRALVLATASNQKFAQRIAEHLGIFDAVIASDEKVNLCGQHKLAALRERFSDTGFDYAGNGAVDRPIWRAARQATLVGSSPRIARAVEKEATVERAFPQKRATFSTYARALRLHQWLKNLLVFVPLVAALHFTDLASLSHAVIAFFAFGLCASSVYVLNDLVDLEDDRQHPRKRYRPFAAGELSIARGCTLIPALLAGAIVLSLLLPLEFLEVLGVYYATTLAYSFKIKQAEVLDILALALLYTLRIVGGGAATGTPLTFWLLAFSLFLFLSLAVAKRCAELAVMRNMGKERSHGRGYRVEDLPLLYSVGVGAGYVATLILSLYLPSDAVARAYSHPWMLWVFCPMLLYWITRVWLKTYRGEMHDDPVVFAVRDNSSQLLALIGGLCIWLAI